MPTSIVLTLCAAAIVAGCRYFPARDEVYPPIDSWEGTAVISGGDTSYVVSRDGHEVIAGDRETLADGAEAVGDVSRAYRRLFGEAPPPTAVLLARGADALARIDTGSWVRRGMLIVVVPLPAMETKDKRMPRMIFAGAGPAGSIVAARWLERFAAGSDSGGTDSLKPLPAWIEVALLEQLADPGLGADMRSAQLAAQLDDVLPLRVLFATQRPAGGTRGQLAGPGGPPGLARGPGLALPIGVPLGRRKLPKIPREALFDAQAASVGEFLAARDGVRFLGDLARRLRDGETVDVVLASASRQPVTVEQLDAAWQGWLADEASKGPGGRPAPRAER